MPAIMSAMALILGIAMPELDRSIQAKYSHELRWAYDGGPEGARAVLSTIAGSMITVAGVVFSITIVALSLASGQFGPRLLRNFIRDPSNQFVLGTFTATFLYCLVVLRTVRGTENLQFVPGIAVTLGLLLALLGMGVLIFFIHHVAVSIQASEVIARVAQELHETIDRLWPEELGQSANEAEESRHTEEASTDPAEALSILSGKSGYIESVNGDTLLQIATEHDLVIRLSRRPGQFLIQGSDLATVSPNGQQDEELTNKINGAFTFSSQRTPFQDVEFAIDQLVEIAVRALSPGINDPFTAMTCIDRLGECLSKLCHRSAPSNHRLDSEQRLRVISNSPQFSSIVSAAFNQIRQYGASSPAVLIRMLETLAVIANEAQRPSDLEALAHHAKLIHRASRTAVPEESDREDIDERFQAVHAALHHN